MKNDSLGLSKDTEQGVRHNYSTACPVWDSVILVTRARGIHKKKGAKTPFVILRE